MKRYFTHKNTGVFVVYITLQIMQIAGTVGVALLLNWMIDIVVASIQTGASDDLYRGVLVCAFYSVALGLLILFSGVAKAYVVRNAMSNLRSDVTDGIMRMKISDFKKRNAAEYISLMNQNMTSLEENYYKNGLTIFENVVSMLFAAAMLVVLNPIVAVISLALMSIPSLIPQLFGKRLATATGEIVSKTASYNVSIKDFFQGFAVVKGYHVEDKMKEVNDQSASGMEDSKKNMSVLMAVVYCFANASGVAVQFLVITIAGILAIRGYLTVGSIIAVTQLTGQVIAPAFQLSAKITQLRATKPIQEDMMKMISSPEDVRRSNGCKKEIELKDVSYAYEGNNVLSDVSCVFERGKHYAIIGKSGSGKSTLLNLVGGLTEVGSGQMMVDGDNAYVDAAMMGQEIFLFDRTIRDNVSLFGEYTDIQIRNAIAQAGLSELVEGLPEGLDTIVEENGARFSGGERQRIALARALLHGKDTILLDETTSALDAQTAGQVETTLSEMKDTTIISITHRIEESILSKYDNIIVLDRGKVAAQGTYHELYQNGLLDEYVEQRKSA
ncbi:MAG: ABC transporter ATP-binding protein [Lachnospiraceae bacterium]|nr:ABC transporter ATP-binding protein [Lachnospiraceae bacterium]